MVLLTLILCVSVFLVTGIEADRSYTVVPGASPSNCTGNQTECSLMYYATHPDKFFRENMTTFQFQAGDHSLMNSTLVLMTNISNLTLIGDTNSSSNVIEARVVCSGEQPGGFSFNNVINLTIENLNFVKCSDKSHYSRLFMAVEINLSHNLTMNNVNIQNTSGFGLKLYNLRGNSVINRTAIMFSMNTANNFGGNLKFDCLDGPVSERDAMLQHVLHVSDSNFTYGYNNHTNKSSSSGIHISIKCQTNMSIVFDRVLVANNLGTVYGGNIGIEYISTSHLWPVSISILNSNISLGIGNVGGGLYMTAVARGHNLKYSQNSGKLLTIENTHFLNNSASFVAAAVYLRLHENSHTAVGMVVFRNCTFQHNYLGVTNNSLSHGGVGLHVVTYQLPEYYQHEIVFFEVDIINCTFVENFFRTIHAGSLTYYSVPRTGALYSENVRILSFKDCKFIKNSCTGVVLIQSNLLVHGENEISENTAIKGGGMLFCASSMMYLYEDSMLTITENNAFQFGGGIFVENDCSQVVRYCFFQVLNLTTDTKLYKNRVSLTNNRAQYAGSALYGGLIDTCTLFLGHGRKHVSQFSSKLFDCMFHIQHPNNDLSVISSDPLHVLFCNDSMITTLNTIQQCPHHYSVSVVSGSLFHVSVVITGQRYGLVSGVVDAKCIPKKNCNISQKYYNQYFEAKDKKAALLFYAVSVASAVEQNVQLKLVAQDYYSGYPTYRYEPSFIAVHVQICPLAFYFSMMYEKCLCILEHTQCNVTNQTIIRSSPRWIGYIQKSPKDTRRIINHPYCPLGYCFNTNVTISTTNKTFDQDVQCAQHRSGLLCGKCMQNYSLGFGSSQCLRCQSDVSVLRVIGLIAVCAVAGVLLVVLLTLLNLTVAEGTLNGLIFYANILQVNQDIFFPPETHARPLTAFIAWLNLDFGITVCFYDGMDAYAKTWLQFLFPLYIWLISGGIIYFSWKSNRVARLTGKNAVKVLATLFLLSFGKLMRTVIAAGSYTNVLSFDSKINISVWLPDANIHYLHGQHTPLFVVAVLTGVMVLLYTLILTFIQCLRRAPNHRVWVWVRQLKPLLDAYTGPYKDRYHFWTGFLLLVRVFLFASFALNLRYGPKLNFGLIIIVSSLLMFVVQHGIYRHQLVGLLEGTMYVNLILFSTVMMLSIDYHTSYKTIAAYVFGGWALLTFLGIIAYHIYKQVIGSLSCDQMLVSCKKKLWVRARGDYTAIQPVLIQRHDSDESEESEEERELEHPSWSIPHVREPLIGSI